MNSFNINIEISKRQKNNGRGSSHPFCHLEFCHIIQLYLAKESKTLQEWKGVQVISYFYFHFRFYFKLDLLCTFFQLLQLEIRIKETYSQFKQYLFDRGYLKLLYFFQN